MTQAERMDHAYRISRDALAATLKVGVVERRDLEDVQRAMRKLEPVAKGFGLAHYRELRGLLDAVEKLPIRIVQPPEGTSLKQLLVMIAAAVAVYVAVALWLRPANAQGQIIAGPAWTIDGDTIVIGGIHIRLQGLDAEELSMAHGQESKAAMVDIVGDQIITCKPDGTRSYERVVASCFLPDGTDISRELVRRGLALDCAHYSHGRYRADEPVGVRQKLYQAKYC